MKKDNTVVDNSVYYEEAKRETAMIHIVHFPGRRMDGKEANTMKCGF